MAKEFDDIWTICAAHDRVIPKDWDKFYKMLKNKTQNPSGSWNPPLPLILAVWHHTSPIEKQMRFKEHIQWACDNQQIKEIKNYLENLPEDEWFHSDEL